ncbi:phosphatidylserine decarboxylase family protein [Desulfohalovibrio reitneri]|uniref:phosphatidylserine decarboxylase family protein n=1 Tax=Desulfohalovibrio reitneri TaxID=1307759 RepID=UPI0004A7778A|nr:phosphatidylserine decarboxylase family protein [Desulfohalovibrio reitneri]
MRPAHAQFRPEGLPFACLCALAVVAFALLEWSLLALLALALTGFVVNFFRDPERIPPEDSALAVAPADGRVVLVGEREDPMTGERRVCVGIFMNVFNVHVNRMPVAGEISRIAYHPGVFFNASLDKASEDNERNAVALEDDEGRSWTMVQIAGLVARRIVCQAELGDRLGRGERFGMIKFGSRVDLYLPHDYQPLVGVGERVLAGQTAVAAPRRAD